MAGSLPDHRFAEIYIISEVSMWLHGHVMALVHATNIINTHTILDSMSTENHSKKYLK